MPPNGTQKTYTRRVNSNGEDVYPTVCATQYKGVQQQMDRGGITYLISTARNHHLPPLQLTVRYDIILSLKMH